MRHLFQFWITGGQDFQSLQAVNKNIKDSISQGGQFGHIPVTVEGLFRHC
jgi:hypothetical protein